MGISNLMTRLSFWSLGTATVLVALSSHPCPGADQHVQTVRERVIAELVPTDPKSAEAEALLKRVRAWAAALRPDGTWPDIDYGNNQAAAWPVPGHLARLGQMAAAFRMPGQLLFESKDLKDKILKGLDHWLAKDYRNANWYPNEITVPRHIGELCLLMQQDLASAQLAAGLKIVRRSGLRMTGANMVELARNVILRGCIEDSLELVSAAFARVAQEIRVGSDEGIQPDWSFHQHGACLYSGGYGAVYAENCARLAYLAHGTRFAFPEDRMRILSQFILDGQQWMIYRGAFDFGAFGRSISRPNAAYSWVSAFVLPACRYMSQLPSERQAEFKALAERLAGATPAEGEPVGNRFFWRSALVVHRRSGYYVSIRMLRSGLANTDTPSNGEGIRSHHLSDGAMCIFVRGGEYDRIYPVWDWERVPGTTVERENPPLTAATVRTEGLRSFAGAVSDGTYGIAAMDLARGPVQGGRMDPARVTLTARKAWCFFDEETVCLGAGIAGRTEKPVLTSVNQCLLRGPISTSAGAVEKGARELATPAWVHHNGVGYVFPQKGLVQLRGGSQSGSWRSIRTVGSAEKVELDVFSVWFDHGTKPENADYAYVLVPEVEAAEMPAYLKNSGVEILSNTATLQAVRHKGLKLIGAAFYEPGRLEIPGGSTIAADQSCIVLVRELADGKLSVALSKPDATGSRPKPVMLTIGGQHVALDLPAAEDAGRSVTRTVEVLPSR